MSTPSGRSRLYKADPQYRVEGEVFCYCDFRQIGNSGTSKLVRSTDPVMDSEQ